MACLVTACASPGEKLGEEACACMGDAFKAGDENPMKALGAMAKCSVELEPKIAALDEAEMEKAKTSMATCMEGLKKQIDASKKKTGADKKK